MESSPHLGQSHWHGCLQDWKNSDHEAGNTLQQQYLRNPYGLGEKVPLNETWHGSCSIVFSTMPMNVLKLAEILSFNCRGDGTVAGGLSAQRLPKGNGREGRQMQTKSRS